MILKIRIAFTFGEEEERVNEMGIKNIMACYKTIFLFFILELLQGMYRALFVIFLIFIYIIAFSFWIWYRMCSICHNSSSYTVMISAVFFVLCANTKFIIIF